MKKTKASYPFLMPDKTNFNGRLNGIQAMPETFFVDSNGETKVVLDKAIRICMECIGNWIELKKYYKMVVQKR